MTEKKNEALPTKDVILKMSQVDRMKAGLKRTKARHAKLLSERSK